MKYITVQIAIRDENRYANAVPGHVGMEDTDHITVTENGHTKTFTNEGDFSPPFGFSKQQALDMIIGNIRYLEDNPQLK